MAKERGNICDKERGIQVHKVGMVRETQWMWQAWHELGEVGGGAPGGGSWQFVEHVHEYGHACMHMRNTHGAWGAYGCMGMWDWVDSRYEIISTGATTTYHYSTPWLRSMGPFIKTSIIPLYFGIPRCRIVNSCTLQK